MKIFFDGGCRPGPAGMELAVVAGGRTYVERDLGPGTGMAAEWLALIAAMRLAVTLDVHDALLLGDAAAVIAQAEGRVRVPPAYRHLHRALADIGRPPGRTRLCYIKRSQNLAGIVLARMRDGFLP